MTFLYIPVISLFTSMLIECDDAAGSRSAEACWQGVTLIRSIVVIFVSLIYIALSLAFALSVFEQDPTDRSEIMSRPHSRIEVYNLFLKTVLSIAFVALEDQKQYNHTEANTITYTGTRGCWSRFVSSQARRRRCCLSGSFHSTVGVSTFSASCNNPFSPGRRTAC